MDITLTPPVFCFQTGLKWSGAMTTQAVAPPSCTLVKSIIFPESVDPKILRKSSISSDSQTQRIDVRPITFLSADYSPQGADKQFKSLIKEFSDIEMTRELRELLEKRSQVANQLASVRKLRDQLIKNQAKASQQKSYQSAAKLRTRYIKNKIDACAKYIPPGEFYPQGLDFEVGLDTRTWAQRLVLKINEFVAKPFKVEVELNPLGGLIRQIEELLSSESNLILVWGSIATCYFFTRTNWSLFMLISITAYAWNRHCNWLLPLLKQYGVDSMANFHMWIDSFHSGDDLEPQALVDDYIDPIADGIFSLIYLKVFNTSYKKRDLGVLTKELGSFGRTQQGVTDFVHWFMQRMQRFLNWISEIFETEVIDLVSISDSDVIEWSKQITSLINEFDEGITVNFEFFVKVSRLKRVGEKLLAESPLNARDRRNALRSVLSKLQPLVDKCKANNVVNNGPRKTPYAIIIGGASRVGKSYTSIPFLHELIARVLCEKDLEAFIANPNDFIMNRVWENDFWDADHAQFCIVYDDFGQSANSVLTKQNEYMEIIRGINSINFPLTMAALTDKGSTNYLHQLLFATTNRCKFDDVPAITQKEAVVKRFSLAVWLAPRLAYCENPEETDVCKRTLDKSKLVGVFDEDVHEFFHWDFLHGKPLSKPSMTYREFIQAAVDGYEINSAREDLALGNMKAAIMKGVEFRKKVDAEPQGGDKPSSFSFRNFVTTKVDNLFGSLALRTVDTLKPYTSNVSGVAGSIAAVPAYCIQSGAEAYIRYRREDLVDILPDGSVRQITLAMLAYSIMRVHGVDKVFADSIVAELDVPLDVDVAQWAQDNQDVIRDLVVARFVPAVREMSTLRKRFISVVNGVKRFTAAHPVITSLIAGITVVGPALAALKYLKVEDYTEQAFSRDIKLKGKSKHAARHAAANIRFHKVDDSSDMRTYTPQASDVPSASKVITEFVEKVRNKNVYLLRLAQDREAIGTALFVIDNIAIVPMHYVDKLLELQEEGYYKDPKYPNRAMVLEKPFTNVKYEFKPRDLDIVCGDDDEKTIQDFALIKFPKLHAHFDLTSYFIEPTDKIFDYNFNIMLDVNRKQSNVIMSAAGKLASVSYGDYSADNCIEYSIRTIDGDCGAPCYYNDPTTCKPIILGIHTAGVKKYASGVSYFIGKKHLMSMLSEYEPLPVYEPQMFISKPVDSRPIPKATDPAKVAVAELPKPHQASYTKLVRSAFYGKWGKPTTTPAKLRPFVGADEQVIDPLSKAFQGYGGGFEVVNDALLEAVTEQYISSIFDNAKVPQPWKPRVWTFEEACAGLPGVDFMDSIPRSTSPGYPLCMYTKKPGKMDFFGDGMEYEFSSVKCLELKRDVEHIIEQASKGIRMEHIFMTFLKDERQKLAKAEIGKTRMISATDLAFLVVCRMYYGDFVRWFLSNRITNGSAVGVNPYNHEWGILFRMLREIGDKCLDGDYEEYDKRKRENLHATSLKVPQAYYRGCPEVENTIRSVLGQEILNPHYLVDGVLWSVHGSMPSGSFFTTTINTIDNNLLMRYAVVASKLPVDARIASEEQFLPFVTALTSDFRCIALGDDNIFSVAGVFADLDLQKFKESMSQLGHNYTASDKSAELRFKSLTECTFLKRGFYVTNKSVLAPLSLATIREMPYWTTKSAPPGNEYEVLSTALYELSLHSEPVFNRWAPIFIENCYKVLGMYPEYTSYKLCRAHMLSTLTTL